MTLTADEYFAKATTAAQAGNLAETIANFRACVAANPNHVMGLLNLGTILTNQKEYAEAGAVLQRAVAAQATVETVSALARVCEATGQMSQATALYQDILKAVPQHIPTLKRLAALHENSTDPEEAIPYYKKAWECDQTDVANGIAYADAVFPLEPATSAAIMDRLLADNVHDDVTRLRILTKLLFLKEFHERMKRGLMAHHATSTDELFFTYCGAEFKTMHEIAIRRAEQQPQDNNAQLGKFTALFCARDRVGAEACLNILRPALGNHPLSMVTFDPRFYRALETQSEAALLEGLPPLIDARPARFTKPHVSYLSCNYEYFTMFGTPLLRSFADKTPEGQVHIHLMDASEEDLRAAEALCQSIPSATIAISAERPRINEQGAAAARAYYHSVRFIRFYQHVQQYDGNTLWMMDVDALFNRNADEMYSVIGDKDAAFRIRAGRYEPWNQFSAAVIGATNTPASLAYFRLVAAYIAHFFRQNRLLWGIDQFAMYGAYEYLNDEGRAPTVAFLDSRVMDQEYLDEGIVWFTAGRKKFLRPTAEGEGQLSKQQVKALKYWRLLDKYNVSTPAP